MMPRATHPHDDCLAHLTTNRSAPALDEQRRVGPSDRRSRCVTMNRPWIVFAATLYGCGTSAPKNEADDVASSTSAPSTNIDATAAATPPRPPDARAMVSFCGQDLSLEAKAVTCHDETITDIAALGQLAALETLDLSFSGVADISPIAGIPSLRKLSISATRVTSLDSVARLRLLIEIDAGGLAITDLRPISALSALVDLDVGGTQISDLRPLSGLVKLERLSLRNTDVRDLRPLASLHQLQYLDLAWPEDGDPHDVVSDFRPLRELNQLEFVHLGSCHPHTARAQRQVSKHTIVTSPCD